MYNDQMIKIERILPNPMRDLEIYPIHRDRIEQLEASYREGDFGTIIPVRPHPTRKGYYQQACGHHRVAAMQAEGKPLDILCRVNFFDDDEMASIMVRENMNNYGNNPEAVADSVAAICKVLMFWMFLARDYSHLSEISERCADIFESRKAFDVAKGQLVARRSIGEPLITDFFGKGAYDSPLKRPQVESGLASLHATGKMGEICAGALQKADQKLAADQAAEIKRAEEADRKAEEAADAEAAFQVAEKNRLARRKLELAETRKLKNAAARKREDARLAREKADADREIKRMAALKEEGERLKAEAAKRRERQESITKARAKTALAAENEAQKGKAPYLHTAVFGKFENTGQFEVFRSTLNANHHLRTLFPVEQQPEIVDAMLTALELDGGVTGQGIKGWMFDQDEAFQRELAARRKKMEGHKREQAERNNKQIKAENIMDEVCAALARLGRAYSALDEASADAELADLIISSPHNLTVRHSLENQYRMLPKLEKFFGIAARRFRPEVVKEEKVINE